ncbi:hypothetical protein [Shewanella gelidii]|uniref:Periplasmic protein n=1 Tax=Shewanella gelidii TaxID=1642821 RepID=A0A917JS11_9GAMM|nr:hypothetical protein [Shewanella gelidii]MCL1099522.1 hypothetical protein [Shewanella gelidii]GGI80946.1 periplasmic protein [Shewanella gelidii]
MKHWIAVFCLVVANFVQADTYREGDVLIPTVIDDQFGNELVIDEKTHMLLFSRDMEGGKVVQQALEKFPQGELTNRVVYVADIHQMPLLVAKFVAIPKMQDFDFSVGLDRAGEKTAALPGEAEKATLILLDGLTVKQVKLFDKPELLVKALATRL